MSVASLVLCVLMLIVIDTAWVALFRAAPVGKFKVLHDSGALFKFSSNAGDFAVSSQTLHYRQGPAADTLPLTSITGLEYRVDSSYALVQELFFGLDWMDTLAAYQDSVEWFSIAVVQADGRRIPLYLSGQYVPREFLLSWYTDLQAGLLMKLGLMRDVEAQSRAAMELIRARLGNPALR